MSSPSVLYYCFTEHTGHPPVPVQVQYTPHPHSPATPSNITGALAPAHQPPAIPTPHPSTDAFFLTFAGWGLIACPVFLLRSSFFLPPPPQYASRRHVRTAISRPLIFPILDNYARAATAPTSASATIPPPTPDLYLYAPLTAPARLYEPPEQYCCRSAEQHLIRLRVPGSPLAPAVPGLWRQPQELELPAAHPGSTTCTYL